MIRQTISKTELSFDVQRDFEEILEIKEVPAIKRQEIVEMFPSVDAASSGQLKNVCQNAMDSAQRRQNEKLA